LRNEQQTAGNIANATIHAAFIVRKYTVAQQSLSQARDVFFRVVPVHGHQDHEPSPDLADRLAPDSDLGVADPL
jgi:hypothetical protein